MKDQHNFKYYLNCMVGGALACGITHLAIVPLDVMKCKKQIDDKFCSSLVDGLKKVKNSGNLTLGWIPTVLGYSMQGAGKFGFYQVFKDVFKNIVGEQNAQKYRKVGWTIASASAQFFADFFLSPFQAVKLKIQLSRPGHQYTSKMLPAFQKLNAEQGTSAFYRGIIPLWSRQIPYTMVKFVAYEWFVEHIYHNFLTNQKHTYSKMTQLTVTFVSGYMAGILCAIASHPADTILSLMYSQGKQDGSVMSRIGRIYKKIGFRGLWNGLLARIIMIGTIAGCQWWIYDTFKTSIGLQTTGGDAKKKH